MSSLAGYLPVIILAVAGIVTIAGVLFLVNLLTPRRSTGQKLEPYECGEYAIGDTRIPIDVKYYIYVLIFLILDVEVVFLIPWAVEIRRFGGAALVEIFVFVLLLLLGWGYAWKSGVLKWLK